MQNTTEREYNISRKLTLIREMLTAQDARLKAISKKYPGDPELEEIWAISNRVHLDIIQLQMDILDEPENLED